jgi:excisionase family DNA binding protein
VTIRLLINTQEAAERTGLSPRTLETLRLRGGGPAFIKLGRSVRYELSALEAWIDANRSASTSEHHA